MDQFGCTADILNRGKLENKNKCGPGNSNKNSDPLGELACTIAEAPVSGMQQSHMHLYAMIQSTTSPIVFG